MSSSVHSSTQTNPGFFAGLTQTVRSLKPTSWREVVVLGAKAYLIREAFRLGMKEDVGLPISSIGFAFLVLKKIGAKKLVKSSTNTDQTTEKSQDLEGRIYHKIKQVAGSIRSVAVETVCLLALFYFSSIIHEYSHAAAAHLLYEDAQVAINTEFGMPTSITYFPDGELSSLGNRLGSSISKSFVAAAGPIMEEISYLGVISCFRTKRTLNSTFILSLTLVDQALTAFYFGKSFCSSSSEHSNDFCIILREGGTVAYVAVATTCLAVVAFLGYKNYFHKEKSA